jgi:hypothetical protein
MIASQFCSKGRVIHLCKDSLQDTTYCVQFILVLYKLVGSGSCWAEENMLLWVRVHQILQILMQIHAVQKLALAMYLVVNCNR